MMINTVEGYIVQSRLMLGIFTVTCIVSTYSGPVSVLSFIM